MTRAKDISKILTDADLSGTLDVTGTVTAEDVAISSSVPILRFTDTDTSETATVQTSNAGHILLDASQGNASGSGGLYVRTQAQTLRALFGSNGDIRFYEDTGTTPKFFWDASAERLGVGTASPAFTLEVNKGSAGDIARFTDGVNANTVIKTSGSVTTFGPDTNNSLAFQTNNTERMRIDGSGNLLVGKTVADNTTVGVRIQTDGFASFARDGNFPLLLNRKSSDGDIIDFRKDGTTKGRIYINGSGSEQMIGIGAGNCFLRFQNSDDTMRPSNSTGANADNVFDFGASNARFDDIFATNGTIQTSDRNEKQDIEELSDAEKRVAVVAKGLMRKFRWIDSVAEKGDNARTHFGIIAQDLQDAFTAEGLDAGDYAMFISDTWTNDDGNEQTRLGVRYNQLLAFIISAI